MKIGLFANGGFYPLNIGGVSIAAYEMARHVSQLGHEVLVVIPIGDKVQRRVVHKIEGVTYKFITTRIPSFLAEGNLEMLTAFRLLGECDVVHYSAPPESFDVWYPFLLKIRRKPQTYWYNGDVHNYPFRFSIFRINQRFLSRIIASCNFVYRLLRLVDIPEHKLAYIPMGIDLKRFSMRRAERLVGDPAILYIGPLNFNKDLTALLKAFHLVVKSVPSACLHIVGDGPRRNECKILAQKLGISDVVFHGWKSYEELPIFYSGADIVVYPVLQYYSTQMGLVPMEALASRRPLVTTTFPGNKEFLRGGWNSILCRLGDHVAIANGILRLHNDKEFAATITRNGFQSICEFDWKKIASRFEGLWTDLLLET